MSFRSLKPLSRGSVQRLEAQATWPTRSRVCPQYRSLSKKVDGRLIIVGCRGSGHVAFSFLVGKAGLGAPLDGTDVVAAAALLSRAAQDLADDLHPGAGMMHRGKRAMQDDMALNDLDGVGEG